MAPTRTRSRTLLAAHWAGCAEVVAAWKSDQVRAPSAWEGRATRQAAQCNDLLAQPLRTCHDEACPNVQPSHIPCRSSRAAHTALHAVCSTPYFVCACDRRGLPGHATIGYAHMCSRPTPQRIRLVPSEIRSRHWSGCARTRTRQPAGAAAAAARGGPDRCHRVEQCPRRAAVLRSACARFCAESERRGRALRKQRNLSQNLRFGQGAGAAAASAHCPSSTRLSTLSG